MSEADSAPRRRPPTIDLTAQDVEAAPQAAAADSTAAEGDGAAGPSPKAPQASAAAPGRFTPYVIGVAGGAVIVAAAAVGLWAAGLFPPAQNAAIGAAASGNANANAATEQISSRLDKIQQALQTPRDDTVLMGRINAAEAQAKSLGDSLATLTRRVDEVAGVAQAGLVQAKNAAAVAEQTKSIAEASPQSGDIAALADRIAAVENAIKLLTAESVQRANASNADDRATRFVVAAEALRAAVERGAAYQNELAAVRSLGANADTTAPLEPFAAVGVPSATTLGRELAALVPALQRANEPETRDASFLDRLKSHAENLVRITPLDAAASAGSNGTSAIARINGDAARGDMTAALADLAELPGTTRAAAESWIKKAQAREAALAASQRVAADALASLGKPVSQ
jgi:hypothetical protein